MSRSLAIVAGLAVLACAGSAPADDPASLERLLVDELNTTRRKVGTEPLELHPALTSIARDRAAAVAASGGLTSNRQTIEGTTSRFYRAGYAPHRWVEGTLIATSDQGILKQWRETRPEWLAEAESGDFEDVGLGVARYRGRPVVSIVLALRKRTVEQRQAAPLADRTAVRERVLAAVNEAREKNGREPVEAEERLDLAAQRHAEDMLRRSYYDHRSPEGETVMDRVRAAGYRGARSVSENIAKGLFSPEEAVQRWLKSPGHRRNVLRRGAAEMGVGVVFGENQRGEFEVVWVQVFAGR